MTNKQKGDIVNYTSNEPMNRDACFMVRCRKSRKGGPDLKGILNDQNLIYQQIAQLLEDGILRGEYPEDSQVPSTNELARAFNINPATAAKGINRLVDEGLLYKRRGIGMFVAEGALKTLQARRRKAFAGEQVRALVREAKRLGMSRAELLGLVNDESEEEYLQ